MEQNLVLHLCTYCCFTGVANKEISQGKLFILSGKVRGNEFCKVVGTPKVLHIWFAVSVCILWQITVLIWVSRHLLVLLSGLLLFIFLLKWRSLHRLCSSLTVYPTDAGLNLTPGLTQAAESEIKQRSTICWLSLPLITFRSRTQIHKRSYDNLATILWQSWTCDNLMTLSNSQNTYDNLRTYLMTKSYDHLLGVLKQLDEP